jgi:hypothetical protein
MFYLNLRENGTNYKNQFKYWTFNSYLWRYDGPKYEICAKMQ